MNTDLTRRKFVKKTLLTSCVASTIPFGKQLLAQTNPSLMRFGLVTYLWGKDMNLTELLRTCEEASIFGVELRTQHAHGVEPSLNKKERIEIRKKFADSPVELVGYGSNAQYHENDATKLQQNIDLTKQYIELMHDCGGSGVKVKPNGFVKEIDRQRTIEQIGQALNVVAEYGAGYGQQIRVEVHGKGTSELPVVRDIFKVADHPNATVCWNSNDVDLAGKGIQENFRMVKNRLGRTVHVREFNEGSYPYPKLMQLFLEMKYQGWILLEARTNPKDKVKALIEQRKIFEKMIAS